MHFYIVTTSPPKQNENKIVLDYIVELINTIAKKPTQDVYIYVNDSVLYSTFQTIVGALIIQQCTDFQISIDDQVFNFTPSNQKGNILVNGKECKI